MMDRYLSKYNHEILHSHKLSFTFLVHYAGKRWRDDYSLGGGIFAFLFQAYAYESRLRGRDERMNHEP